MLTDLLTNHLDPGYVAAARRRAEQGPRPPVRRLTLGTASAVAALTIGLVLAVAYGQAVARAPEAARTRAALVAEVEQRSARTDELQRRAEALRQAVVRERAAKLAGTTAGTLASEDLLALQAVTGLARVQGPGLVVRVADGPPPVDPVTGEPTGEGDLARVQDRDLQDIVNALWASGAEAVSINEQRLAATSAIRSAGGAVLVDFRPVSSPYTVRAIGNPDRLPAQFDNSGAARRFRGYEQQYGMTFSARREERLTLPAAPAPEVAYARPAPATAPATEKVANPGVSGGSSTAGPDSAVPSPPGGDR
jgi:uncharacterized protein YlxW (UPF0749 family)